LRKNKSNKPNTLNNKHPKHKSIGKARETGMAFQRTIQKESGIKGIGIHTGLPISLLIKPAEANTGIRFIRTDLPGRPVVPALLKSFVPASGSLRRTSIGQGPAQIHTVEHLLATLSGFSIDNVEIYIDGPELPGLDGSASGFVRMVKDAGLIEQDVCRRELFVREPICVKDNDSMLVILPDVNLKISYTLDYPTTHFKAQYAQFIINQDVYENEIAPSRTFCIEEEVERLRSLGFGKGASLDNTVVVGKKGVLNGKLRFEDEFVRHKILDLIGDLYLLGAQVRGHVIAIKSGHNLNIELLGKIAKHAALFKNNPECEPDINISSKGILDREDIEKILPHRYPFLMVDRIVELNELSAIGIKKLSMNDYFFAGHFPGNPVMPGVLMLEALAQVGGVILLSRPENKGKTAYFMLINNAKFRRIVRPGDELRLEVEVVKYKTRTGQVHGRAFVEDSLAAEADLNFAFGAE
jgi:UDP-3-O-[3-hydroxymyristoyl] N-acetylglucosamine deacetylase / 3-hydroxyacyl-[acyl-carrier-protein] dehydratase